MASLAGDPKKEVMSTRCEGLRNTLTLLMMILISSGCANTSEYEVTPTLVAERVPRPTPASTLPELIENLSSDEAIVREVSAYALRNYDPEDVAVAVPELIENLYHNDMDVQMSAASMLGWLGPRAQQAVPDLIATMEDPENSVNARRVAANALGSIGDQSAIPALARQLYQTEEEDFVFLEIRCAESIARLTNQKFRDVGEKAYYSNDDGVPWIVTDARYWWEHEGQYQNWKK